MFDALKENCELKDKSKNDAETLSDKLAVNQVLMEELKVKDAIIKANENISKSIGHDRVNNIEENVVIKVLLLT